VTATHVLLLRHGATAHSASGRYSGRVEYALSEGGMRQAERWRPTLDPLRDLVALTSPLSRAVDTASAAGRVDARRDDRLLEWDLGSLEGQEAERFRAADPSWNLFADGVPDGSGESPSGVSARARSVVETVETLDPTVVLLVSHGQFLRALAMEFVGLPLTAARAFSLGPARAGLVTRRGSRWSMTGWNVVGAPGFFDELT